MSQRQVSLQTQRIVALEALLHDGDGLLLIRRQSFRELGLKPFGFVQEDQPDTCRCLNWVVPVSNDPRLRVREGDLYGRNQDQKGHADVVAETIGSGGWH
ncbi:hypothetical protein ALQ25_200128 [Pseudomonas coronafaciens pv. atropurpurea]|nr:hypothetical protein ALQ25_200128 [Pseudomonas coronafaciens pv. atropurpurea]